MLTALLLAVAVACDTHATRKTDPKEIEDG
jgi:hypothetical protein